MIPLCASVTSVVKNVLRRARPCISSELFSLSPFESEFNELIYHRGHRGTQRAAKSKEEILLAAQNVTFDRVCYNGKVREAERSGTHYFWRP